MVLSGTPIRSQALKWFSDLSGSTLDGVLSVCEIVLAIMVLSGTPIRSRALKRFSDLSGSTLDGVLSVCEIVLLNWPTITVPTVGRVRRRRRPGLAPSG